MKKYYHIPRKWAFMEIESDKESDFQQGEKWVEVNFFYYAVKKFILDVKWWLIIIFRKGRRYNVIIKNNIQSNYNDVIRKKTAKRIDNGR